MHAESCRKPPAHAWFVVIIAPGLQGGQVREADLFPIFDRVYICLQSRHCLMSRWQRYQSKLLFFTVLRILDSFVNAMPFPVIDRKLTDFDQDIREISPPGNNEVQVAVQSTGLCGSDLHYYNHYRNGDIIVREPLTLGHESSGTVVSVGSEVVHLVPGDRVALEVGLPCDECEYCVRGRYNICRAMRFRSSAKANPHAQGTLQERINHPAKWCHK